MVVPRCMKPIFQQRVRSMILPAGLTVVLLALAVLQYRWSGQVSEAEATRMKARLDSSAMAFRQDLSRELALVCRPFRNDLESDRAGVLASYAEAYRSWKQGTTHVNLIANVYLVYKSGQGPVRMWRLDPARGAFKPDQGPNPLGQLPELLAGVLREPSPVGMIRGTRPGQDYGQEAGLPPPDQRAARGQRSPSQGLRRNPFGEPWGIVQAIPALVHPILSNTSEESGRPPGPHLFGFVIVQLAPEILSQQVFAELAERHFGAGMDYQVAVLGVNGAPAYSSDPSFEHPETADAKLDLFGSPPGPNPPSGGGFWFGGFGFGRPQSGGPPPERGAGEFSLRRLDPIRYSAADRNWQLVVRHRRGSLASVVAASRRRNLALSFGVLLVLAATMAMVVVASQRAHRLAQLQMEFVAGVSHELRTPLSVIASAADNITDGVVADPRQLARYGAVIKKHARQLNQLIEHVMLFAATRQNRLSYALQAVPVEQVIAAALAGTEELINSSEVRVEPSIQPGLPPVMGDLSALSHCLQNLITNGIKYGGEDRWLAVRATAAEESGNPGCVRITVEDHGAGIARSELREIFQPFYRGADATAAQIHGTGLGLPLARSVAEAMGGRLSVVSELGKGSSFTIHLRVAEQPATERTAAAANVS